MDERAIARAIGLGSLGFGAGMLAAPLRASRLFGMREQPGIVRFLAARDLVIGAGLLSGRASRGWTLARAVADTSDAAMLAVGLASGAFERRAALGIVFAATLSALGFWLAGRLR